MEQQNNLYEQGNTGEVPGSQISGAFTNSANSTLPDIVIDNNRSGSEVVLTYPMADGNAILVVAGTDGKVAGMQMLSAGTTSTTIDTGKLSSGSYLLMIQNSMERRIIRFVK